MSVVREVRGEADAAEVEPVLPTALDASRKFGELGAWERRGGRGGRVSWRWSGE
jgi:hypothetical protein